MKSPSPEQSMHHQPLDGVIKELRPSALPDLRGTPSRLVIVDRKAGRVLPKRPFFTLGKEPRYFVVSPHVSAVCKGPRCRVRSFTRQRHLELGVDYEARCPAGNEETAALALVHGATPAQALDRLIETWVEEFAREKKEDGVDLCVELERLRGELQRSVARRAREATGLVLDVTIEPTGGEELEAIEIEVDDLVVHLKDCDDEIEMGFKTRIEVDLERESLALLSTETARGYETRLVERIRRWLVDNATLNEFSWELTGSVKRRLITEINAELDPDARVVKFLALRSPISRAAPDLEGLPEEFVDLEASVRCHIQDAEDRITVIHRLVMSVRDFSKFRAARIGDLDAWAREKLERISRTVLFDKRYLDILLGAGPEEIRRQMELEAEAIGYALKQMVVIPDLEPLRWKDGLDVEIADAIFATADSRVEVKLDIVMSGKIVDLRDERLARHLTPQARDIREDIAERVTREVEAVLHKIDPERFYMRFYATDVADERPVKELLEDTVGDVLRDRFAFEDTNVILKRGETELTQRLEALQSGTHRLEVDVLPLREGGHGEAVTFHLFYDVVGVHQAGWNAFRAKRYETVEDHLEELESFLATDIQANLATLPGGVLRFSDIKVSRIIEEVVSASIPKAIDSFGLVLRFTTMRRAATAGETLGRKVLEADLESSQTTMISATEKVNKAKLDRLDILLKKEQELLREPIDDDDDELTEVREQIKKLSADVVPYPKGRKPKALPSSGSDGFSLDDYRQIAQRSEGHRKELEASEDDSASTEEVN